MLIGRNLALFINIPDPLTLMLNTCLIVYAVA